MRANLFFLAVFSVVLCLSVTGCQSKTSIEPESVAELAPVPVPAPVVTEPAAEAEKDEGKPQIVFEKTVHDFGQVGEVTTHSCVFKFKNAGDAVLKITEVTKTCGCTPYQLDKKVYKPGESGELKVKYNTSSKPGKTSKKIFVESNDPETPKTTLTIKADITQKVTCKPTKLNLVLNKENAGCPAITIESTDGTAFSIKAFKNTGDCLAVDFDPSQKATRFVLQPKVDIERLKDVIAGKIEITLDHPKVDKVTTRFDSLPRFKIKPAYIALFNCEPGKPINRKVWILNNYNEDFEVESLSSRRRNIKVISKEKIGNRYNFELEITPPTDRTGYRENMFLDVFDIKLKDGEKLQVPCRGFYSRKKKDN